MNHRGGEFAVPVGLAVVVPRTVVLTMASRRHAVIEARPRTARFERAGIDHPTTHGGAEQPLKRRESPVIRPLRDQIRIARIQPNDHDFIEIFHPYNPQWPTQASRHQPPAFSRRW